MPFASARSIWASRSTSTPGRSGPTSSTQRGLVHCAVGTIRYGHTGKPAAGGKEAADGYLLYIKPSITGSEPGDVLQYRAAHAAFPHESTSDQWFGESQFESYRKLGHHITRLVFDGAGIAAPRGPAAPRARGGSGCSWPSRSAGIRRAPRSRRPSRSTPTGWTRSRWRCAGTTSLRFLDAQIYPEWDELMKGREAPRPLQPVAAGLARGRLGPASTSASTCSS